MVEPPFQPSDPELADQILRALRRVSRAIDLHSRKLASDHHLTAPQLVCLRQVAVAGPLPAGRIASGVSLSNATVTGILTRLESQGLVRRDKDEVDRRRVLVSLTEKGRELVERAPFPLQERFFRELEALPAANRSIIATVLEQVVDMMAAESLDASPVMTTGPVDADADELDELLASDAER
jgi:DNA-binding MarR family transcriptional regulator